MLRMRGAEGAVCDIGRWVKRVLTAAQKVLFVDERRGIALQRKIVHGLALGLRRNRRRLRLGHLRALLGEYALEMRIARSSACTHRKMRVPRAACSVGCD